ncbi:MAG: hypothetical protein RR494_02655 [Vagococcus sp.]|uniref:hypothetical protein n=1 Tax=Vagococcus sp. TaxID=1933889 RepID=UPI002FCC80B7
MNDLTGKKFGRLTIIEKSTKKYADGTFLYKFKCDCGNECYRLLRNVRKGDIKSCGCLKDSSKSPKYLMGKRFGDFKIIRYYDKKGKNNRYLCECSICGEKKIAELRVLNSYEHYCTLRGNKKTEDLTGLRFGRLKVIEITDRRIQDKPTWVCQCDCGRTTQAVSGDLKNNKVKSCGCLVSETGEKNVKKAMEKQKNVEGTNLTRIKLDKPLLRNNTTGVTGVIKHKKSGKWLAQIQFKGKDVYLGIYSEKRDAINARKKAEEKYFKPILEKYNNEVLDGNN